jgi:ketosteroid isomerase-like protein
MTEVSGRLATAIVQRYRDRFGRGPTESRAHDCGSRGVDAPGAELRQPSGLADADEYRGREELVRGTGRWLEGWRDFRFTAEEVVDLGERAFMRVRLSGRGKASGVELEQTVFHLWTFRDGMPWRCEVFDDEDAAQQAAGLRE